MKYNQMNAVKLEEYYKLIDQGKFTAAFKTLELLEGEDLLEGQLIKAIVFVNYLGEFDEGVSLTNQILDQSITNPRIQSFARVVLAFCLMWQARFKQVFAELERAEQLNDSLPKEERLRVTHAFALAIRAYSYQSMGQTAQAIDLYKQSIQIAIQPEFPLQILGLTIYHNLGTIYRYLGEWDRAIMQYNRCLEIADRLGNIQQQSYPHISLGKIYHAQGALNYALKHIEKGETIAQQFQDQRCLVWALSLKGAISHSKSDFTPALKYYQQLLEINNRQTLNASDLAMVLYRMCLLHLDMRKPTQAQLYLEKLQKQSQIDENIESKVFYQLANALLHKSSQRFKDLGEAQEFLRDIYKNNLASQDVRFLAMLHLCDLLLLECKLSDEAEIFIQAQIVANKIFELAETRQFIPDRIWALIFKAKFALIEGDAQMAFKLLDEAQYLAEDKELKQLIKQVEKERIILQKEMKKWQELFDRNASIHERIKHAEIENYLLEALKIRNQTLDTRS